MLPLATAGGSGAALRGARRVLWRLTVKSVRATAAVASDHSGEQQQAEQHRRQAGRTERQPDVSKRSRAPQTKNGRTERNPACDPDDLRRAKLRVLAFHPPPPSESVEAISRSGGLGGPHHHSRPLVAVGRRPILGEQPPATDHRYASRQDDGARAPASVRYRTWAGRRRLHRAYIRWFGGRAMQVHAYTDRPLCDCEAASRRIRQSKATT
jgi:hypothetical protein